MPLSLYDACDKIIQNYVRNWIMKAFMLCFCLSPTEHFFIIIFVEKLNLEFAFLVQTVSFDIHNYLFFFSTLLAETCGPLRLLLS